MRVTHQLKFKSAIGISSRCEIEVIPRGPARRTKIVLMTETHEGVSVTNAAEIIATEAVAQLDLDTDHVIWIEHYPEAGGKSSVDYREATYDLVTFSWDRGVARRPSWSHLPVEFVLSLLQ